MLNQKDLRKIKLSPSAYGELSESLFLELRKNLQAERAFFAL